MGVLPPTPADIESFAAKRMNDLGITPPKPDVSNLSFYEEKYRVARERHIENATLFLTRKYELESAREEEKSERDQQQLAALTEELRAGFLSSPGAIEDGFQSALPTLLHQHRQQAALSRKSDLEQQVERSRSRAFSV